MTDNNKEVIIEMIDIFIDQVGSFRKEMYDLYEDKDIKALGQLAHKAKSSVSIMGMHPLAQKLKELELKTSEGSFSDDLLPYIQNFDSETREAVTELLDYKKNIE